MDDRLEVVSEHCFMDLFRFAHLVLKVAVSTTYTFKLTSKNKLAIYKIES